MERLKNPSLTEILDALTDEDSPRDWDMKILTRSNKKDLNIVLELINKGFLAKEIRLELKYMEE